MITQTINYFDTLTINALMLNIDTSLPFRNNPFEEHELIFSVPFVCALFQRHAHNRELMTIHVNSTHWNSFSRELNITQHRPCSASEEGRLWANTQQGREVVLFL